MAYDDPAFQSAVAENLIARGNQDDPSRQATMAWVSDVQHGRKEDSNDVAATADLINANDAYWYDRQ